MKMGDHLRIVKTTRRSLLIRRCRVGGRRMAESLAGYNPMSIKRLGGRTCDAGMFPPPPLKFRTAVFSPYCLKLDCSPGELPQAISPTVGPEHPLVRASAELC